MRFVFTPSDQRSGDEDGEERQVEQRHNQKRQRLGSGRRGAASRSSVDARKKTAERRAAVRRRQLGWWSITAVPRRSPIFATGAVYGKMVTGDAAIWRAGSNDTTRLTTQAPLQIGDT